MKTKRFYTYLIAFTIIFSLSINNKIFAEDTTPKPYDKNEFPQALQDFRRFEIITLGAMPFVTLDVSMVYSGYLYLSGQNSSFNPLGGSSSYTSEQQIKLLLTSFGICAGIGLTDYIVQVVKRNSTKKINQNKNKNINITPISQDSSATQIPLPQQNQESTQIIPNTGD